MIKNKSFIFLFIFLSVALNAKVIEVQQLFNKKVTKVKKEEVFTKKSFYGSTKIDESKVFDVVTRFDGYITKLKADKNYVNIDKGSLLFSIYSDEILSIQKELQVSKDINSRVYNKVLDKLKHLAVNEKEIQRIKENSIDLNGINFYARQAGLILNKNVNENGFIKKGKRLMQIVNIDKLWFIAKVYQEDLKFLKEGSTAKVYIDGISKTIDTKVDFIYPIANEESKTIDVRFIIDNKNKKIFPNMFGKVDIKSTTKTMLTLPKTAVLNKASSYYVFKNISDTQFEPIKVEVNRINSNTYEIVDGLKQGDEVINNALFLFDSDAITNMLYESGTDEDW